MTLSPFDFTVIDETQDLSVADARLFAAMAVGRGHGLFFGEYLGQSKFQQPFSWKALGLDVRGSIVARPRWSDRKVIFQRSGLPG
jgi:predicted dienelactone hydrolase